jgi:hypothetical protein
MTPRSLKLSGRQKAMAAPAAQAGLRWAKPLGTNP